MVWPAAASLRTPSGLASACSPMVKKVALTQLSARICNTWLLLRGNGPSSKVSTTSWFRSGSVSGYCMVPIRGCSRGSTTIVREVPIASGWPGQSSAATACAAKQVNAANHKMLHDPNGVPNKPLPTMKHRLHSHSVRMVTRRAMNAALTIRLPHKFRSGSPFKVNAGPRRHHMHHVIVVVAQITQKCGQHRGGLCLGIVQQDNSPAGGPEAVDQQVQFLLRRHPVPVAGPQIGPKNHDAARLQQVEQCRCRLEAGKAEERRRWDGGGDLVQRHLIGGDAAVDLLDGLVRFELPQVRMRPGVMADRVSFRRDPSHQVRMRRRRLADQEK